MATRRPLVVIDGIRQELPVGDTIAGAPGGGSGGRGLATIDLGSTPQSSFVVTVTDASITSTSDITAYVMAESTVDNNVESHRHAAASWQMSCEAGTGSFQLYIDCMTDLCWGTFKIRYAYA